MSRQGGQWDGMGTGPQPVLPWNLQHGQHVQHQHQHQPPGAYPVASQQQMMYAQQQQQYIQQQYMQQQWIQQNPQQYGQQQVHPSGLSGGVGAWQQHPSMAYQQGAAPIQTAPQHLPQPAQHLHQSAPPAPADPDDDFSDFTGATAVPNLVMPISGSGVLGGVARNQPIDLGEFHTEPDTSLQPPTHDMTFEKGNRVMYAQRDGTLAAATVVQVDKSIVPYSYGIRLDSGSERETEGYRLKTINPGPGPGQGSAPVKAQQFGSNSMPEVSFPSHTSSSSLQPQIVSQAPVAGPGVTQPPVPTYGLAQTERFPAESPQPAQRDTGAAASLPRAFAQPELTAYDSGEFGDFFAAADQSSAATDSGDLVTPAGPTWQQEPCAPKGQTVPPAPAPPAGQTFCKDLSGGHHIKTPAGTTLPATGDDEFGSFESPAAPGAARPQLEAKPDAFPRRAPGTPLAEDLFCETVVPDLPAAAPAFELPVIRPTNPFMTGVSPMPAALSHPNGAANASPALWPPASPSDVLETEASGNSFGSFTEVPPSGHPAAAAVAASLPAMSTLSVSTTAVASSAGDDLDTFGDFGPAPPPRMVTVAAYGDDGDRASSRCYSSAAVISTTDYDFGDFSTPSGPAVILSSMIDRTAAGNQSDGSDGDDDGFGGFASAAVQQLALPPPPDNDARQQAPAVGPLAAAIARAAGPLSLDLFGDEDHGLENAPISLCKSPALITARPTLPADTTASNNIAPPEEEEDDDWGDFGAADEGEGAILGKQQAPAILLPSIARDETLEQPNGTHGWEGWGGGLPDADTGGRGEDRTTGLARNSNNCEWSGQKDSRAADGIPPGGADVPTTAATASGAATAVAEPADGSGADDEFGKFGSAPLPADSTSVDTQAEGDESIFEPEGSRLPEAEAGFETGGAASQQDRRSGKDSPSGGFDAFEYFGGGDDSEGVALSVDSPAVGMDNDDFSPFAAEFSAPPAPPHWDVIKDESGASDDIFAGFPESSAAADDGDFGVFSGYADVVSTSVAAAATDSVEGSCTASHCAEIQAEDETAVVAAHFGAFSGSASAADFGGFSNAEDNADVNEGEAGVHSGEFGAFSNSREPASGAVLPPEEQQFSPIEEEDELDEGFGAFAESTKTAESTAWSAWHADAPVLASDSIGKGGIIKAPEAISANGASGALAQASEQDQVGDVLCALLQLAVREIRRASQFWKAAYASGQAETLVAEVRFQQYVQALVRVVFVWRVAAAACTQHLPETCWQAEVAQAIGKECNVLWTSKLDGDDSNTDSNGAPSTLHEAILMTLSKSKAAQEVSLLDWSLTHIPDGESQLCGLSRLPLSMFNGVVETVAWEGSTKCLGPVAAIWTHHLGTFARHT